MHPSARVLFYFNAGGVTPAMALTKAGAGSDYALAYLDGEKTAFDGSKTYRLHLPPNVPVNDFWALTLYDTQTRSQLQTDQRFPTVGSQTKGMRQNPDGSYDIYSRPRRLRANRATGFKRSPARVGSPSFGCTDRWSHGSTNRGDPARSKPSSDRMGDRVR